MQTRPVLVLDACEETLQVLAGQDGPRPQVLWHERWQAQGRSMGLLGPALEHGLQRLGLAVADLGGIAVVRGPGSFTGLRIVLSTALGLSLGGGGVPLAGLDHLPLLAAGAAPFCPENCRTLAVLTYARRGLVYFQAFDPAAAAPLGGLRLLTEEAAAAELAALGGRGLPVTAVGSALRRPDMARALQDLAPRCRVLPQTLDEAGPSALLAAALE